MRKIVLTYILLMNFIAGNAQKNNQINSQLIKVKLNEKYGLFDSYGMARVELN